MALNRLFAYAVLAVLFAVSTGVTWGQRTRP